MAHSAFRGLRDPRGPLAYPAIAQASQARPVPAALKAASSWPPAPTVPAGPTAPLLPSVRGGPSAPRPSAPKRDTRTSGPYSWPGQAARSARRARSPAKPMLGLALLVPAGHCRARPGPSRQRSPALDELALEKYAPLSWPFFGPVILVVFLLGGARQRASTARFGRFGTAPPRHIQCHCMAAAGLVEVSLPIKTTSSVPPRSRRVIVTAVVSRGRPSGQRCFE